MFPDRNITGPNSHGLVSPVRTLQAQINRTASDELAPSAFDPSLEYSTNNVVLFWHSPSYFSQWYPSPFVVDGVSYSCAEQFMMAEKTRLF